MHENALWLVPAAAASPSACCIAIRGPFTLITVQGRRPWRYAHALPQDASPALYKGACVRLRITFRLPRTLSIGTE